MTILIPLSSLSLGYMEMSTTASSQKDSGTLYHLRNLINRRNVVKKPEKSVTACEDFF